jgi:transcription antitermination protein NusB
MTKKSSRHLSRSLALQAIYNYHLNPDNVSLIETFLNISNSEIYNLANYELMHFLIETSLAEFTEHLNSYQPYLQRTLNDIGLIEKIILVIAGVELKHNLSVPAKVIINEAVELGKLYGAHDSYKFINGLVDKLATKHRPLQMKPETTS